MVENNITLPIKLDDLEVIDSLAKAIEDIISRPYDEPSLKYSCPKTASALYSFKKILDDYLEKDS